MSAPASPRAGFAGLESALELAVDELAHCRGVRPLRDGLFEISFASPQLARRARPGEFAQILVDSGGTPFLRRPFSFSRADPASGLISFYLAVIGEGSSRLRRFREGQEARILGPLGRGFTLPTSPGSSLLVAGGLGAAPFPLLIERLRELGERVSYLNGARAKAGLYPREWLPEGGQELIRVTEDGSSGRRGLITDLLPELLPRFQRVYACGPNPMLARVHGLVAAVEPEAERPQLEVSIEAPMGCGFGTCLGCAIPLSSDGGPDGYGLCCRQGPVLLGAALDWERLLAQPAHLE